MSALPPPRASAVVTLTVRVEGTELPGTVAILGVEVVNQANRIPYARLRIGDGNAARGDFAQSSGKLFVPGHQVELLAGYHGETDAVFSGTVLCQRLMVRRGDSCLEVDCRDPAFKMTLVRRNRHFEDVSDGDVAETLLGEYNLTADIAATGVVHPQLLQYQATDWDFMVGRLESAGQICLAHGGTVSSVKPSLSDEPVADIGYGVIVLELDAELDARSQTGAVRALAWDPAAQGLQEADAADPGWASNGNLDAADLSGATGRAEDLLWHGGSLATDALQAWADGAMLRARLAATRGRVRFQGLAAVRPGSVLQLSRLSDRFNGKVYVTGVRHEFSDNNWTTDAEFGLSREIHAERMAVSHLPAAGLAPAVNGLQVGIVTQLSDDPAHEHRIRVKVPLAGMGEQGVWARLATLDAGDQRGTFFRPEVDDEVVLGFFHDDPAQPVVLGMLHSSAKAPPLVATDDNHQKAYFSRSGISLLFDDDKKVVTLETPGGNRLSLSDDDGGILFEDQNGNKLVLNGDGIALTSAKKLALKAKTDLKAEAANAEIRASASLKVQAIGTAKISSSGTLTVKGAMVMIN
jgi:Rhs element Vgr protein